MTADRGFVEALKLDLKNSLLLKASLNQNVLFIVSSVVWDPIRPAFLFDYTKPDIFAMDYIHLVVLSAINSSISICNWSNWNLWIFLLLF